MARWVPSTNGSVEPREHVGRRLFDEPMLVGATGQNPYEGLDLRNFEEKRGKEFSLDRLGRTGIEGAVESYLIPRADNAGEKFRTPRAFNGWFVLSAKTLSTSPGNSSLAGSVIASPISGDGLEENIYHCHFVIPDATDHYTIAFHLRHLFAKHGKAHVPQKNRLPRRTLISPARAWRWLVRKIFSGGV